jgi:hypothetical protein
MKGRVKGFISITEIEDYVEELEAEIDELVEQLAYLRNKPVIRLMDWDDADRLIAKHSKGE